MKCKDCIFYENEEGSRWCVCKELYTTPLPDQECDEFDFYGKVMFTQRHKRKLWIYGKAVHEKAPDGVEVWTVATNDEKADLYFEFHNIKTDKKPCITTVKDYIKELKLPLNNSISIMLAYAYKRGFEDITIVGCPMAAKDEYIAQARSVAYICGFLQAKGIDITWKESFLDFDNIYPNKNMEGASK